jgi:hypothetical protein
MLTSIAVRQAAILLAVALVAPAAHGYIHFPPMTLQKMCGMSHHARLLKVAKCSKDKGVIVFEAMESLKGQKSRIASFKQVLRADAVGGKPIFDWVAEGKTAVIFWIESRPDTPARGLAYVFIDNYCYSAIYTDTTKHWTVIRGEPDMSACYYGSIEQLRGLVKDILQGKNVKVPVKNPEIKENGEQRKKEINEALNKNQ